MSIVFNVFLNLSLPPYPDFFLTYHLYVHLFFPGSVTTGDNVVPSSVTTDDNIVPSSVTTDNEINVAIYGITLKLPVV